MRAWQQWLDRPEKLWVRQLVFQLHFWVGAALAAYLFVISVSGSLIVFRGELFALGIPVEGAVDLHANLMLGAAGRSMHGIGGLCLTLLCLTGAVIWWPGLAHWRRSLTVEWHASFPRLNWDVHSALGFWGFPFVLMWGLSGSYLVFPDQFAAILRLNPGGPVTFWLADAHFGRFSLLTKILWTVLGLVPGVLAFTGMFICCRRVIFKKPSNPSS